MTLIHRRYLWLDTNAFSGTIPASLLSRSTLRYGISWAQQPLMSLSVTILCFTRCRGLGLSANQFIGNIPSLSALTNLQYGELVFGLLEHRQSCQSTLYFELQIGVLFIQSLHGIHSIWTCVTHQHTASRMLSVNVQQYNRHFNSWRACNSSFAGICTSKTIC